MLKELSAFRDKNLLNDQTSPGYLAAKAYVDNKEAMNLLHRAVWELLSDTERAGIAIPTEHVTDEELLNE